ncbi:hypothetical protein [uncultured Paraglaciecola sp.]|uniref:hypothetical protein n=1 Tax=uncultured Paraglaciecola sp. TaxID=1765024 RepID=UPI0025EC9151|nr:hypothetical protein [uncultured Paraglaciecola sp.]
MRLLILFFIVFTTCSDAESFTINIVETYEGHTEQISIENIYTQLYAPLKIIPKLVYYPSKRGLRLVNQGVFDAEAGRFELTAKHYPNLIKVNEPLDVFHSGFYCLNKEDCNIAANTNIVILSSFQSAPAFCESSKLRCRFESKPIAIVRMLEKGIAQAFLSSTIESNKVLCALQTDKLYFHNEPTLARLSYHFVNKRHVLLVPKLEHSMRQLKQKGLLPNTKVDSTPRHASCGKDVIAV